MKTVGRLFKQAPTLTVFVIFVAILVALALHVTSDMEFPILLFLANLFFVFFPLAVVSYLAADGYTIDGSLRVFMVGCSSLAFGVANLLAGTFIFSGDPNAAVTVHNTGAMAAALFMVAAFFAGVKGYISSIHSNHKWIVAGSYGCILLLLGLLAFAATKGLLPKFITPGHGVPLIRMAFLGGAAMLFGVSTVLAMYTHIRNRTDFTYWYSVGLLMLTVGLFCVLLQGTVGTLLGWIGRISQYAGCIYLVVAVFHAHRVATETSQPLGAVVDSFFKAEHRLLMQSTADAIIAYRRTGKITEWNEAAERIFGYSSQEVVGRRTIDEILGDSFHMLVSDVRDGGSDNQMNLAMNRAGEIDVGTKAGLKVPCELTTGVIFDYGEKKLYYAILRDVSDRKALQSLNQELERRVLIRTRELSDANTILTAQTEEIRAINDELTAQNEEIRAMNDEISSLNQNLTEMNEALENRVAERTVDLTAAHQELTAQYQELVQAQEELRDTDDHLRKLIQYANAPIIVWDPDFVITRFNGAFERLSGYAATEVIGKPVSVLFAESSWTEAVTLIELSRGGMHWESVEIPIRRKTGEVRVALWNSANIFAADGVTLTAVIAQGLDITDRVRREQEIQRDAQLATRVQNALLSVPKPTEFLDIATIYKPFSYVGGDLYFLDWRYGDNLLRGFLLDTTGHGLGTALHTASLHVLLREVNELDLPLSDAMRWLNRRASDYFDEATFAGALGFEIDLQTKQLRWACAGVPEMWVATHKMKGSVKCPGMCLGIREEETFDTNSMPIEVGDSLYFMTDGLSDLLKENTALPLDRYSEMQSLLQTLSESTERRDDATAICIHVRAFPQSVFGEQGWPRILRFSSYGDYQRLKGEIGKILTEVTGLLHTRHEVVVHEALANAMECRDGVPRPHKARLRFNKVGNRLIVRVKTSRIGFAGNAILRRLRSQPEDMFSFGEDASMGRGIPLMLSMAHKMTYNSEGTELLLAWKLHETK